MCLRITCKFDYNFDLFLVIKQMSSNFLQRFKGKTQQISKDGVHNILGSKKPESVYNPNQEFRQRNFNSVNNTKPNKSTNSNFLPQKNQKKKGAPIKAASITTTNNNPKKAQNPFLIENPFYLDEEQKEREQIQKKQRKKLEEETKKAEQQVQLQKNQNTKTSLVSRSVDKKKKGKQWVKMGGLGANIGGDQWLQRKKKKQKMEQFAGQVKNINAQRIKPPRPDRKQQVKDTNPRQKALEYSKNVPRPAVRRVEQKQQEQQTQEYRNQPETELTELQLYQMKHEQLKKMINNQY